MKEWYLMDNYKPNAVSGFEGDVLTDFAQSNYADLLTTAISDTVLLYDSSLGNYKEVKCLIQGNTADTQLKSMERTGLFPIGTVKAGMYVFFDGAFWLITGYPGNNKSYEKATLILCQYKLKWQNADGVIVERWINASSGSKYDIGESETKTITLASDNLILLMPDDEETLNLDGKRVFIDKRPVPTKVYKITRSDDVLFDYGIHGGILSFITDRKELNANTDNQELGICDYISPTTPPEEDDKTTILTAKIEGNTNIKVGFERTYTASIIDENGDVIEWDDTYSWNVISFVDVDFKTDENKIKILVENEDFVDEKFKIQVLYNKMQIGEMTVNIVGMI